MTWPERSRCRHCGRVIEYREGLFASHWRHVSYPTGVYCAPMSRQRAEP